MRLEFLDLSENLVRVAQPMSGLGGLPRAQVRCYVQPEEDEQDKGESSQQPAPDR